MHTATHAALRDAPGSAHLVLQLFQSSGSPPCTTDTTATLHPLHGLKTRVRRLHLQLLWKVLSTPRRGWGAHNGTLARTHSPEITSKLGKILTPALA